MSVQIQARYDGGVDCTARHEPSGRELRLTAPTDNGGDGSSFSPTDLVATGLLTCVLVTMAMSARKRDFDLPGMKGRVEKRMITSPNRRIGQLPLEIWIPGDYDDKQRATVERAATHCPVHQSLKEDLEIEITFHWGVEPPAELV
mgnify:CR=1 FL=1